MTALLRYDAARQALAEARSYDEVRDWEDKAAAVREYARRSRNREMEIDALEIRVRAQRRRGELLAEMRASGRLVEGRKKTVIGEGPFPDRVTLDDLDTTKNESSLAQRLASIEPDAFERLAARCRAHLEGDERAHSFDVLRERDGPVNGARAVMGSRAEPDDSLDYFPTPPWATRALFERVLPHLGADAETFTAAWEPACGEGHIAEVLREYFEIVISSDVFAYGYRDAHVVDFLTSRDLPAVGADWIITNPPFGDNAEAFVLRALDRADIGVAMFFRLQWLETIGRFERIFSPYPPAVIAQFAERVPLHKGRWEPDGSTATAYLWIVWLKEKDDRRTEFFWIPPGCKDSLTKPGDRERFTAHPVLPIGQTTDGTKFDPATGEINSEEADGGGDVTAPDQTSREQAEAGEPSASGDDPASDPFAPLNYDKTGFESDAQRASALGSMPKRAEDEDDFVIPSFLRHDSQRKALPEKRGC